jgi:hypothetical protein
VVGYRGQAGNYAIDVTQANPSVDAVNGHEMIVDFILLEYFLLESLSYRLSPMSLPKFSLRIEAQVALPVHG